MLNICNMNLTFKHIIIATAQVEFLKIMISMQVEHSLSIDIVSSSKDLFIKLHSFVYDIIVVDEKLETLSGLLCVKLLRRNKQYEKSKILLYTENMYLDHETRNSFDSVITQEDSIEEILYIVQNINRNKASNYVANPINTSTNLIQINSESYTVSIKNNEILLPKLEFEILNLLNTQPNKIFGRDEIIERIWGDIDKSKSRSLDVHIARIRKKIGSQSVVTIKGVGYKLKLN